jgi:hypothetical protein
VLLFAAAAVLLLCWLQLKHPLLVELMGCFASLLKEYKSEVEDILVADKQVCIFGCQRHPKLATLQRTVWEHAEVQRAICFVRCSGRATILPNEAA